MRDSSRSWLDRVFDRLGAWFVRSPRGRDWGAALPALLRLVDRPIRDAARAHLPILLEACRAIRLPDQVAYLLATADHESRLGHPRFSRSVPLVEDHNPFRQTPRGWVAKVHTNGRTVRAASRDFWIARDVANFNFGFRLARTF